MKKAQIFVISGKARSGKDTVAGDIQEYYKKQNKSCITLAYATPIKEYAKKILSWDGRDETKPRDFLQYLGTEFIRKQIDPNFFLRRMKEDILIYSEYYDIIIITDARFIEEIEMVKNNFEKVITIKVEKPNLISNLTEKQQQHATEISLNHYNNYDYVIMNDDSLEKLKQKVYNILNEVKE